MPKLDSGFPSRTLAAACKLETDSVGEKGRMVSYVKNLQSQNPIGTPNPRNPGGLI